MKNKDDECATNALFASVDVTSVVDKLECRVFDGSAMTFVDGSVQTHVGPLLDRLAFAENDLRMARAEIVELKARVTELEAEIDRRIEERIRQIAAATF